MAYKFTGSTASVCGTAVKMVSADDDDGSGEIDVTSSDSTTYQYEAEIDDPSVSIDCIGADAIARGTTGATSVTWNDGGSTSLGTSVVTGKKKAGSIGDKIVHTLKIRPARTP